MSGPQYSDANVFARLMLVVGLLRELRAVYESATTVFRCGCASVTGLALPAPRGRK